MKKPVKKQVKKAPKKAAHIQNRTIEEPISRLFLIATIAVITIEINTYIINKRATRIGI